MPLGENERVCHYCGFSQYNDNAHSMSLAPGTILNGKYIVGKTLGEGGFGITYLAWDLNMETKIAIKEFFPTNLVSRDITSDNGNRVYTFSDGNGNDSYEMGLKRYAQEAAVLTKFFQLPGIVTVKDFFYENGTAYIVMEYVDGITLKEYLKQNGDVLSVEETVTIMYPILKSLEVVHQHSFLHRDISPDNIMIAKDKSVKLIDFGAARFYDTQNEKSMTVVLKHGYAPIEQYSRRGQQGTWTDIYGLCATMYRMLTGKVPEDSVERIKNDTLIKVRELNPTVPNHIAYAIEKGLAVQPEERYYNINELIQDIYNSGSVQKERKKELFIGSIKKILIILAGILFAAAVVVFILVYNIDKVQRVRGRLETVFMQNEPTAARYEESEIENVENSEESEAVPAVAEKSNQVSDSSSNTTKTNIIEASKTESDIKTVPPVAEVENNVVQSQTTSAQQEEIIVIARDGKINGLNTTMTVGEILDGYSDSTGLWSVNVDEDGTAYVYYQGSRENNEFVIEFLINSNSSFKISGALQNGVQIADHSGFFQDILDTMGIS